ncbi:hypothetical protein RFI_30059, partial [Reticulomyxa filosa]
LGHNCIVKKRPTSRPINWYWRKTGHKYINNNKYAVSRTTIEDEGDNVNLYPSYFISIYRNDGSKVDCSKEKISLSGAMGKKRQEQQNNKMANVGQVRRKQAIFEVWFIYLFLYHMFSGCNMSQSKQCEPRSFRCEVFYLVGVRERRKKNQHGPICAKKQNVSKSTENRQWDRYGRYTETNASDNGNITCLQLHNIKLFKDTSKIRKLVIFPCWWKKLQLWYIAIRSIIVSFFDTKELYYRYKQDWNEIVGLFILYGSFKRAKLFKIDNGPGDRITNEEEERIRILK